MKVKPLLGDWEIPRIASIKTAERRSFVELAIPGGVGSQYQDLNTMPTRIAIAGSLFGDESRDEFLNSLRGKYKDGNPVTFVADIITATDVQYVVIEDLRFEENASLPGQMDYYIALRESPPPPPPPDPLGGLDAGLLDEAGGFLDSVTGALDAISSLTDSLTGGVPDFSDPTKPLSGTLDTAKSALGGLDKVKGSIGALFGTGK